MLNPLRRRNHVLPGSVFGFGLVASMWLYSVSVLFGTIGVLLMIFFLYLELVTQWSFRAPPRRKPAFKDERFKTHILEVNGHNIAHYISAGRVDKPTVWMCHGWTSGAYRMGVRAASFLERGWTVILVDLPGHGISDSLRKWTAEETTSLLIQAFNQLHHARPELFSSGVVHYGHSMGSFVGLRISHRRSELNEGIDLLGWVLESPMTGYSEIFIETCKILRIPSILRPIVLRKTLRHFNALNEGVAQFSRLSDADAPAWGMPQEKALLVQAMPDERLGSAHYERLIRLMESESQPALLTTELLNDLTHSGSHVSPSRKAAVDTWLDEHYSASSA